jgi:hypothetical protein
VGRNRSASDSGGSSMKAIRLRARGGPKSLAFETHRHPVRGRARS